MESDAAVQNGDRRVRFGDFEADLHAGELRKMGDRVKLQDQPFKVLQILLERPGDLITREELRSRIWPEESFGDFDHAVNIAVGKLRAALGDSPEHPMFIETVPRRGYRFVGKLDPASVNGHSPEERSRAGRPSTIVAGFKPVLLGSLAVFASAMLLGLGIFVGRRTAKSELPYFQSLTVNRGTVYSARFAPDGHSAVYAASWDGDPIEIFATDLRVHGTSNLGFPTTHLLALSSSGEMAVLQSVDYRFFSTLRGTLGQVPMTGGSPRQIAENVDWADWDPSGANLAIVREISGKQRLEFPMGHVVYETAGWISHPRISPAGDQIAFLDHPVPLDDQGCVSIVDHSGHKKVLSSGWESLEGLAWNPNGREIWFSGTHAGIERQIYAVDLAGRERLVFRAPAGIILQDIAPDGSALLVRDEQRGGMIGLAPGAKKERELSWHDWSIPTDISRDGKTVLFDEQGVEAGPSYTVAARDLRGSPPIPLGKGMAGGLSPDGKWASAIVSNARLLLLPVGVGSTRELERGNIEYWHGADWLPDGKHIVFSGIQPGHAVQCFIQNVDGGKPRPVTPEGVSWCQVSPDGKTIAGDEGSLPCWLYPLDGGQPRVIPGLIPGESFSWTSDPHFMYVYDGRRVPVRVYRMNVFTGERHLFREIVPPDVAGLRYIARIYFSSDGQAYVYNYTRMLSQLYLVRGLK